MLKFRLVLRYCIYTDKGNIGSKTYGKSLLNFTLIFITIRETILTKRPIKDTSLQHFVVLFILLSIWFKQ